MHSDLNALLIFFFFNRRGREEEDYEDKTCKENLNSSVILSRATCYEELMLWGRELYEDVKEPDCTYTPADTLGKYK